MSVKATQPWIEIDKIDSLVQLEPVLITLGLIFVSIIIYKVFLREVSEERHRNLRNLFKNLAFHILLATATFAGYFAIFHLNADNSDIQDPHSLLVRAGSYIGLISVIWWCLVFVKTSRILLFEYLFLSHMRVGVPLLLVNLFSLLLTAIMGGWLATALFNIKLAPLLATSAIFSVVLGLALQDTLGNLFAGVAMTFDKPYEIGDWIEITLNGQKWIGKVEEISWRATVLTGLSDESISVPNRLMGQTQISNFSTKNHPICRSQIFRIVHGTSVAEAKKVLRDATTRMPSILKNPAPFPYVWESNESFVSLKLVYFIGDFGKQYLIGDEVITAGNEALQSAGFELAPSRLLVVQRTPRVDQDSLQPVLSDSTID